MCLLNALQHGKFRSGENPVLAQCVFPWSQRNGSNGFRTIGMLRDPVWANVELRISSAAGALYDGESVKKYASVTLVEDATVVEGANTIGSNSGIWAARTSPAAIVVRNTIQRRMSINASEPEEDGHEGDHTRERFRAPLI